MSADISARCVLAQWQFPHLPRQAIVRRGFVQEPERRCRLRRRPKRNSQGAKTMSMDVAREGSRRRDVWHHEQCDRSRYSCCLVHIWSTHNQYTCVNLTVIQGQKLPTVALETAPPIVHRPHSASRPRAALGQQLRPLGDLRPLPYPHPRLDLHPQPYSFGFLV